MSWATTTQGETHYSLTCIHEARAVKALSAQHSTCMPDPMQDCCRCACLALPVPDCISFWAADFHVCPVKPGSLRHAH